HEVDDVRRFDADLLDVFVVDDDVASLLELVALDQLGVRHLAFAVGTPPLLLDARLALGMELVEGNRVSRFGGRKDLYRNVDKADLEEPFPSRAWRHMNHIIGSRGALVHGFLGLGSLVLLVQTASASSRLPKSSPVPPMWIACALIWSRSSRRACP